MPSPLSVIHQNAENKEKQIVMGVPMCWNYRKDRRKLLNLLITNNITSGWLITERTACKISWFRLKGSTCVTWHVLINCNDQDHYHKTKGWETFKILTVAIVFTMHMVVACGFHWTGHVRKLPSKLQISFHFLSDLFPQHSIYGKSVLSFPASPDMNCD